jgi:hypothetical protein
VDVTPPTPTPGEECIPRELWDEHEDDEEDEDEEYDSPTTDEEDMLDEHEDWDEEEDSPTTDEEDMLDEHEEWDEEEVVERDPYDYGDASQCWGC